jgi:hypothetical protein
MDRLVRSFLLVLIVFALSPTRFPTSKRRAFRMPNRLIIDFPDHERRNIDHPLAYPDMPMPEHDPRVMNRLGNVFLADNGLQPAFHELFDFQRQHVIQLPHAFVQEAVADHPAQQGVALEDPLGVLLLEGQQLSGCFPELG